MYHNANDFNTRDNGIDRLRALARAQANGECMACYRYVSGVCPACRAAADARRKVRRAERLAVIRAKQGA